MSFRKIRPSFGDNSASTSNPSQSTSESTGSDPRRVRNEKDGDTSASTSTKRRRVPDSVTRNACLNCKKARAKVCAFEFADGGREGEGAAGALLPLSAPTTHTTIPSPSRHHPTFTRRELFLRGGHDSTVCSFANHDCSAMAKSRAKDVPHG